MGIINRRNAVLGWAVWQFAKQAGKRKAKAGRPRDGRLRGPEQGRDRVHLRRDRAARSGSGAGSLTRRQAPARSVGDVPAGFVRPALAGLIPYEPGKPVEEVQRELGLERVVKLASNEGPLGPFPQALAAMERATAELNRYPDGGAFRLRSALAERHGVRFEEIAVGSGADGFIDGISQAVIDPGRRDRLRLAVVSELRHLRAEARRRSRSVSRCATTATTSTRCSTRSRRGRSSSTSATRTTRPAR